jgi:hypothetical protein
MGDQLGASTERSLAKSRARANNTLLVSVTLFLMVSQIFLVVSLFELKQDYHSLKVEKDFYLLRDREADIKERELVEFYNTLKEEHGSLISNYQKLQEKYIIIKEEAVTPPYILVSGREAFLVWRSPDGSIMKWTVPMDAYRAQLLLKKPTNYLIMEDSKGVPHKVMDFRPFVSPAPFQEFAPELYERAGSKEAFIYEVWSLVTQLSAYTPDIGETPRWPLESLVEGGGDCEDVTILIASILLASGEMDEVGIMYMDAENPTDLQHLNHIIVYVRAGDYETFIDGTSSVMNPFGDGVDGFYYPLQ